MRATVRRRAVLPLIARIELVLEDDRRCFAIDPRSPGLSLRRRWRATGAAALHLDGARGGSAEGTAAVSQDENPAEIALACAGSGLRGAKLDIDLQTSPSISG
jgi:hypothetical protein